MAPTIGPEGARRHCRAEDVAELHHVIGTSDLQNVHCGGIIGRCDDEHLRSDLTHRERDVGVRSVVTAGDHHRRFSNSGIDISSWIVEISHHHAPTFIMKPRGTFGILH